MLFLDRLIVLDIFATGFGLNMRGHSAHKTTTGLIFTLLYAVIILALSYQQLKAYLDKTSPISTSEVFSNTKYARVDLVNQRLVPFFVALNTDTDYIPAELVNRYLTLRVHRLTWITRIINGQTLTDKVPQFYGVVTCSELSEEEKQVYDYIDRGSPLYLIFMRFGMCPKVGKTLIIEGQGSDAVSDSFFFNIKACSLPKSEDCISSSQVSRVNFKFIYPTLNFDPTNYESPHKRVANADNVFYVAPKQKQIYTVKLRESQSLDNDALTSSPIYGPPYFELSTGISTVTNRAETLTYCPLEAALGPEGSGCGSYFTFAIQSSGDIVKRKRSYRTLSQTVSSIGGLNGLLTILFVLLYRRINNIKRANFILQTVYSQMIAKGMAAVKREDDVLKAEQNFAERIPSRLLACCRRRDRPARVEFERQKKLALQRKGIEESLDVVNIVRDSYLVRVMSHILLKERHLGLAQLVDVNLWDRDRRARTLQREDEREFLQAKGVGMLRRGDTLTRRKNERDTGQRIQWMKEIKENCKLNEGPEMADGGLETRIDRFYQDNLDQSEFDKEEKYPVDAKIRTSERRARMLFDKRVIKVVPSRHKTKDITDSRNSQIPIHQMSLEEKIKGKLIPDTELMVDDKSKGDLSDSLSKSESVQSPFPPLKRMPRNKVERGGFS